MKPKIIDNNKFMCGVDKGKKWCTITLLQKTNEVDQGVYVIFAADGCIMQCHMVQKINHRQK
jgi:hypothetical protein